MGERWWRRDTRQIVQSSLPLQAAWVFLCWTVCCKRLPADRCEGSEASDWLLKCNLQKRDTHLVFNQCELFMRANRSSSPRYQSKYINSRLSLCLVFYLLQKLGFVLAELEMRWRSGHQIWPNAKASPQQFERSSPDPESRWWKLKTS